MSKFDSGSSFNVKSSGRWVSSGDEDTYCSVSSKVDENAFCSGAKVLASSKEGRAVAYAKDNLAKRVSTSSIRKQEKMKRLNRIIKGFALED